MPKRVDQCMRGEESWRVFRIMGEFVEGFDDLSGLGPCVSIFGSARLTKADPAYHKCVETARLLGEAGFGIITGGGPGIMEAANRGASEASGLSIGLGISLPREATDNPYITRELAFEFHYFFTRKFWFVYLAKALVVFPGGFGTMDEFFESLTLMQTLKIAPFPVVVFGTEFWKDLLGWMRNVMLEQFGNISKDDLDLFIVTDDVDEVVSYIHDAHTGRRKIAEGLPRFATDEIEATGEGTRLGVERRKGGRLRTKYDVINRPD